MVGPSKAGHYEFEDSPFHSLEVKKIISINLKNNNLKFTEFNVVELV